MKSDTILTCKTI